MSLDPTVHKVVLTSADGSLETLVSTAAPGASDPGLVVRTIGGGGGGGDGALLDGVDPAIKATVFDFANSNPVAVTLRDTAGDPVSVGGGTQYTEDDASAANPTGTQLIARRRDTLASETSADGDVTALNSTAKGELYVKQSDQITVIGTKTADYDTGAGTDTVTMFGVALPASGGAVAGGTVTNPIRSRETNVILSGTAPTGSENLFPIGISSNGGSSWEPLQVPIDVQGTKTADYDTGAGIDPVTMFGLALPGSGGAVPGGTATNPVQVAGAVTANAGTNLNTSALALETTQAVNAGHLQAIEDTSSTTSLAAHNEDAASLSGDIGMGALAIRKATPANTSNTDGDYEFLQMSAGRLWASATIDAPLPAGSNVIGAVTANAGTNLNTSALLLDATFTGRINTQGQKTMAASTPVVLASDQSAVPVSGTTTSNQGSAGSADWRMDLRRGLALNFAAIDVAASGDNTLVAADATRKVKVLSYVLVADAAVTARWKSGAAGNLSGAMSLAANGGAVAPAIAPGQGHWLETAVNQALVLNLGGAVGVRGHLSYVLEA
jgi:hypothetical protein